jgi:6-phosphofructokinase 2
MADIVTLTMNPAIDLWTHVDRVEPTRKLRCQGLERDPGGGGINVARVVRRMGARVTTVYPSGGMIGHLLDHLIEREDIERREIPVAAETRENFVVHEDSSNQEFRFNLAGPRVSEREWRACFDTLAELNPFPRYLVASGSLPPGVPDDFYARVAQLARDRNALLFLDTSGRPLKEALAVGVYLIKPNLNELCTLMDARLDMQHGAAQACRRIVEKRGAEVVTLTLGDQGAFMTAGDLIWRVPPLPIAPVSAVGAGDSFLGGMVWGLASGHDLETAFRYGVAAGSAALLTHGTQLCRRQDVERLYNAVTLQSVIED